MQLNATTELIAASVEGPLEEMRDFDSVVQLYWPVVFRFALASLRDRDAAETVTQDCFLNAYRGRDRFRGDAAVKTWLMQIAVNLIRDRVRNRRWQFWRRTQASGLDPVAVSHRLAQSGASPEAQALVNDQVREVWKAAEGLSPKQRVVFLLRFVEDMELREIAEVVGSKEGTVKVHLFRALRTVRARMKESQ